MAMGRGGPRGQLATARLRRPSLAGRQMTWWLTGLMVVTIGFAGAVGVMLWRSPGLAAEYAPATSLAGPLQINLAAYRFTPANLLIPADTSVAITVLNTDARTLNFTVDELHIDVDLAPGEARRVTLKAPGGSYDFYDAIPGHRAAGMEGTLDVAVQPPIDAGMPGSIDFAPVITGLAEAMPPGLVRLRLERLAVPAGAVVPTHHANGPELIDVRAGTPVLVDAAATEFRFEAGQRILIPLGTDYGIRNGAADPIDMLRLSVVEEAATEATPAPGADDGAITTTVLFDVLLKTIPSAPVFLFLAETTWVPGAELPRHTFTEALGLYVESGVLTASGPSGIEGQLQTGKGIVLPAGGANRERNAGTESATVLLAGIMRPGEALLTEPIATPAPPGPTQAPSFASPGASPKAGSPTAGTRKAGSPIASPSSFLPRAASVG
jgi:hypothetical protein